MKKILTAVRVSSDNKLHLDDKHNTLFPLHRSVPSHILTPSSIMKYFLLLLMPAAIFTTGLHQNEGGIVDVRDATYDMFKQYLTYKRDLALENLNYTCDDLKNISRLYNNSADEYINNTLIDCYNTAVNDTPGADPNCLEQIALDTQLTINNSMQEFSFCTNLTWSWEELENQFQTVGVAVEMLDNVVNMILEAVQPCEKRYPNNHYKEWECMENVEKTYDGYWKNATDAVCQTNNRMMGYKLLMVTDEENCQDAEIKTLDSKCTKITNNVESCAQSKH